MRNTKSYWDKYATQRSTQRSAANLRRQRGTAVGRAISLRGRARPPR